MNQNLNLTKYFSFQHTFEDKTYLVECELIFQPSISFEPYTSAGSTKDEDYFDIVSVSVFDMIDNTEADHILISDDIVKRNFYIYNDCGGYDGETIWE